MKKVSLICTTLLAGISLTACGNSSQKSSEESSSSSSVATKTSQHHKTNKQNASNSSVDSQSMAENTDYQQVNYDELDSNSDDLNGENIAITGTITKANEEDGSYVLVVSMDNNQAENVMVAVDSSSVPKGKKLSKGDQVTIKGTGGGKQSTPDELTDGQNIPYMDCEETVEIR